MVAEQYFRRSLVGSTVEVETGQEGSWIAGRVVGAGSVVVQGNLQCDEGKAVVERTRQTCSGRPD